MGLPSPIGGGDPVARVLAYLRNHPVVAPMVGGAAGVGGRNAPPYPRIVVSDPPGPTLGSARRIVTSVAQIEALGDVQGFPGRAVLKPIAYAVIDALRDLPDIPTADGDPVITWVDFGALGYSPLPNGQGRYLFRATLTSHAP